MRLALCLIVLGMPLLARAASIQLEATDGTCFLEISPAHPTGTFFIAAEAVESTGCGCLSGAEFRVAGLSGDWFTTATPNPGAILTLGDPLGSGANVAFAGCLTSSTVLLYTVQVSYLLGGTPPPTTLRVVAHATPSNPNYACPLLVGDVGVVFCQDCVDGGVLYINGNGDCTVGARPATWTQVKGLYE